MLELSEGLNEVNTILTGMYFDPIYYSNVIKDEDEKKYYLFIPTKCGAGIPGPDVSKVIYEEVTNVCIHYIM